MSLPVSFVTLQRGPYLKLKFTLVTRQFDILSPTAKKVTEEINIENVVKMKFKFKAFYTYNIVTVTTSISMMTPLSTRDYYVTLKVVGRNYSQHWECQMMYMGWIDIQTFTSSGQSEIELDIIASKTELITFVKLYGDTELTDFTLSTAEGDVAVHKACLAAHSDFFKTMFSSGNWKENESNSVELKGVTMNTLNHLKDYLYLGTLPKEELKPLFLVARCYLMESLRQRCLMEMVQGVTAENLYDLIDFACENNAPELVRMLLQHTNEEVIYGAQAKPVQPATGKKKRAKTGQ